MIVRRPKVVPTGRALPAMESAGPSRFLTVPDAEWVCANDLCCEIFDAYPVSLGHVVVITRRVVPTFFESTTAEQESLMALVGEVKGAGQNRLHDYESGWLTLLVSMRVATEDEARAAMSRVAQKAIDDREERRERRRQERDRRRKLDSRTALRRATMTHAAEGFAMAEEGGGGIMREHQDRHEKKGRVV